MSEEEDEYGFERDLIEPIVQKAANDILIKETYDDSRTQLLIDLICERVLGGLGALGLPMKYIGEELRVIFQVIVHD